MAKKKGQNNTRVIKLPKEMSTAAMKSVECVLEGRNVYECDDKVGALARDVCGCGAHFRCMILSLIIIRLS